MATSNHPQLWYFTISGGSLMILFSSVILSMLYHRLAPHYPTVKKSAWILTTISSTVMTLSSLPFLYDYFSNGGSVKYVRDIPRFSVAVNRFFQSYLVSDLALGTLYYRSQITVLNGWIHHIFYTVIVELAIRWSWSHLFCLCAAMEAPVFLLGFMTLHPKYRNDVLFAVAFFTVRILFHIVLGVSYFLHDNRAQVTGGSYIPSFLLAFVFPLHVVWFRGCIMGFYRRASRDTPVSTLAKPEVLPENSPAKDSPPPPPEPPSKHVRAKLSR